MSADYNTEYIRYQAQPELSRIAITSETIRGHRGVDHFNQQAADYQSRGYYQTGGRAGDQRVITKVETIDGYEIKTLIKITPPSGFGDGVLTCSVKILVDGQLRASCPIGYNHRLNKTVLKIVIYPEAQIIEAYTIDPNSVVTYNFINDPTEVLRIPAEH